MAPTPQSSELATDAPVGELETVALLHGPMLTGVTVSHEGRIFVNFPKWGDDVQATVAEVRDGRPVAYPDEATNRTDANDLAGTFVSVQSVVVDPADRLWVLDTGRPMFERPEHGGPKLVCADLQTDRVVRTIVVPLDVALPTSYLNDVRFDLGRGNEGTAYITDSSDDGPNGIVVVDLESGESWRRLHGHPSTSAEDPASFLLVAEGRPLLDEKGGPLVAMGSDGIAIGADGSRLYYCPLAGSRLYSVSTDALADRSLDDDAVAATVRDEGDKGGAGDGMESDSAGRIYATNYEHNAVLRREPDGRWGTVAHDPRLLWPDTLSLATDGHLYVTANQLHRQPSFNGGKDLRRRPYALFRVRVDAEPVLLR